MEVGAVLIKLKPNSFQNVDSWKDELNTRKYEAIESLKAEGVEVESWFSIEIDHHAYLLAYMRAENIEKAQEIGKQSQLPIDQVHQVFKQTWESVIPAKLLVDLENK